jgi:hypothetical protein
MTDRQKFHLYLPAWRQAAQTQHWNTRDGRKPAARLAHWGCGEVDALYQLVWNTAQKSGIVPSLDEFRHSANLVASEFRVASSAKLRNWEIIRFLALCNLLHDSEDLRAMRAWCRARRSSLLWELSFTPPAVVDKVAHDIWKVDNHRQLNDDQLLGLAQKFRGRKK